MTAPPSRLARPSPEGTSRRGRSAGARRRLRALVWRARFLVVAAALGLAAAITVGQLRPPPPVLVAIVVADRPVLAGEALTSHDVRTERVPPQARPADALQDPAEAVGRILVVPVSEGTVLSAPVLVAADGGPIGPPGTVVAAVRLGEPALARMVSPGMHVDLLAPTAPSASSADEPSGETASATYLARRALVLPRPLVAAPGPSTGLDLGTEGGDDSADLILVAVTPEEAAFLANVAGWSVVTAVVVQ